MLVLMVVREVTVVAEVKHVLVGVEDVILVLVNQDRVGQVVQSLK